MNFVPCAARFGAALLALAPVALFAIPALAQGPPTVGSANPAVADPPVPRPSTQPVVVPLFNDVAFADFSSKPFSYSPPAGRVRHWAKIILVADFSVTAGRQYDRTAQISIGHTNVFFGTTAEPSRALSPAWHVERDVTDYGALLASAQPGQADIGNLVNSTYTGVIHGTASLLFFPAARHVPLPPAPDLVLPLPAGGSGVGSAGGPADTVSATYTFPTNVTRVYLDLITQSQGGDEFWYFGVPNDLTGELQSSGNTAFREAEVTVDGAPAGVAPVFPWIYTGGIDPYLWRPIPGLQTLSFAPYRVDLTPFAGLLNDGQPHTVGVRVFNDNNYFQIAGALLLFRDPVLQAVPGALTADTLTADPAPVVQTHLTVSPSGEVTGPVSVTSDRRFTTAGYVLTSAGKVTTRITQTVGFSSVQQFDVSATKDVQNIQQLSSVASATVTHTPYGTTTARDTFRYPLTLDYSYVVNPDGSAAQATAVHQGDLVTRQALSGGVLGFFSTLTDTADAADTLVFDTSGGYGPQGQHSAQTFSYADTAGGGFLRTVTAANGVLTSVTDGH